MSEFRSLCTVAACAVLATAASAPSAQAQTHVGNVVIDGSLCVGFDCPSSPSFSDATILLMENNTRIKFGDTSSTASFPRNDWELEANNQSNGGANRFSLLDCGENSNQGGCANDIVFAVEAGVRSNALYVESDGDIGIGTSNPAVDLTIVTGNTPTVRLEQDGSSGFAPQTWDMAGNEANFFIRDATNGSTLPVRIRPGAPTSAVDISADGDVGMGDSSPDAALDIRRTGSRVSLEMEATTDDSRWQMIVDADSDPNAGYSLTRAGTGAREFRLTPAGDLIITGEITTSGSCSIGCDRVFDADYLVPSIEDHAALMWENKHLPNVGPTYEEGPYNMSDKVLRILNELEYAHIYIAQLHERLLEQDDRLAWQGEEIEALKAHLAAR